jgi:hypothetical protein
LVFWANTGAASKNSKAISSTNLVAGQENAVFLVVTFKKWRKKQAKIIEIYDTPLL